MNLYAYNEQELQDLADWILAHIQDAEYNGESVPESAMFQAYGWICYKLVICRFKPYPQSIPIESPDIVKALQWAIDDWSEVMESNDEAFSTHVQEGD